MEENCDMENYEGSMKFNSEAEEENGDETLSLCDLPVILTKQEDDQCCKEGVQATDGQEDFDFHSWGGPETELDMCSADEVFFHGQILPLHPSANSEFSLTSTNTGSSGLRVNNSRSSSIGSQNSSTSTTSSEKSKRISSSRERNQFHSLPSPNPQIRNWCTRERSAGSQGRRSVSAWEFFRLGVVPAPEIGLKDLKSRHSISVSNSTVSRNSSSSSSNKSFNPSKSNRSTINRRRSCSTVSNDSKKSNHGLKQILGRNGGFFGGCKCTVETVQQNTVIIKNGTKNLDMTESVSATHALEKDKVLDVKKQKQKIKQAMSHRRTFEWLTGFSHVTYPNESFLV